MVLKILSAHCSIFIPILHLIRTGCFAPPALFIYFLFLVWIQWPNTGTYGQRPMKAAMDKDESSGQWAWHFVVPLQQCAFLLALHNIFLFCRACAYCSLRFLRQEWNPMWSSAVVAHLLKGSTCCAFWEAFLSSQL